MRTNAPPECADCGARVLAEPGKKTPKRCVHCRATQPVRVRRKCQHCGRKADTSAQVTIGESRAAVRSSLLDAAWLCPSCGGTNEGVTVAMFPPVHR